jgi:ubiquinone/menaquinone biosynthesis C-methylase UbiE
LNNDAVPSEMLEHYREVRESERLSQGIGELERIRTQDILRRYLPKPGSRILDVGGAAGVHALWLAREGYEVHLIDPVPHHVEQAREASGAQQGHPIASCVTGDARQIPWPDQSVDAVLFLGPLYHLVQRSDRLKALREAHRVLQPGGKLFAATVSRFGSLLDGLARDLVADPQFVEILRQDLRDGQHRNPTNNPNYFTTAFFHHPEDLRNEIEEAGFRLEKRIGIEGPAWLMASFSLHWNNREKRRLLLELLQLIEEDYCLLGASAHMMGIARKSHGELRAEREEGEKS